MLKYQIIFKKLPRHFDIFLYGILLNKSVYVYQMHRRNKYCKFYGTLPEVLDKLCDKGFIKNATKRETPKDGKPTGSENRMRILWNKQCRVSDIIRQPKRE